MEKVKNVASYILNQYEEKFNSPIDEMKLHKLLYFAQRESFIQYNRPLFDGAFHAGKYGPVVLEVRGLFKEHKLDGRLSEEFIKNNESVFNKIWTYYAIKSSWSLSLLSHGEISWKNAREQMKDSESLYHEMSVNDIQKDAERIRTRRFRLNA